MHKKANMGVVAIAVGASILLAPGCQKTNEDKLADLVLAMAEKNVDAMEEFFDIVEENWDICNQCVRQTAAVAQRSQAEISNLHQQYMALKAQASLKDQRGAIERVAAKVQESYQEIARLQEANFKTFEEYNKHCGHQMGKVYATMEEISNQFHNLMRHEF